MQDDGRIQSLSSKNLTATEQQKKNVQGFPGGITDFHNISCLYTEARVLNEKRLRALRPPPPVAAEEPASVLFLMVIFVCVLCGPYVCVCVCV
jgi:hypothetical protein